MTYTKTVKTGVIISCALVLSACSSVPKDGGVSRVADILQFVDNELVLPGTDTAELMSPVDVAAALGEPLSLRVAEQMSVDNNPIAKSMLANVGIAEADYAQAGRMENPGISYERFSANDNARSYLFDIGGVLLMPLKRQVEARRLESAQYDAAIEVLTHVSETRQSWINAVAEKQQTALITRALESVEASNNLTRQMAALGHSSVVDAARSELLLGEFQTALIRQRLAENSAKEALIRQLGLWGEQVRALTLPEDLPPLPRQPIEFPAVEQRAIEKRLDVQLAKLSLEGMAKNLKLTQFNPFFSALELGSVREQTEGEKERGYEIELRLPIFDTGSIQNEKARIIFEQAQARAEVTAIAAASSSREALAGYQSAWEIARHLENEMLPLRARISAEQLLQYNGMLISVFDLLKDLQSATSMESEYVNAVRTFWLADNHLQSVLTGTRNSGASIVNMSKMPGSDVEQGH